MGRYNPHEIEKKWIKRWEELGADKYDPKSKLPIFSIDTPPPYPTGRLHMGHVLNWCYMDFVARYKRMRGYSVFFPQGWDCHGLPTEVKVEETHKIRKNDIPREKFRQLCTKLINDNILKMKEQMQEMGFSIDWEQGFRTMDPDYYSKTQLSFLKFHEKGLVYKKEHPVNWCPRCGTAIAFAEIEYKDRNTQLNFVKFRDESKKDIIIATTRPELLCACVAAAVNPKDKKYAHLTGKYLTTPLYDRKVKVITAPEVDPEFGTGIVMICTFGDKTDVLWTLKHKLPVIEAIDREGKMTEAAGKYKGMALDECKKQIIRDLKGAGLLIRQEQLPQSVGTCWRCKSPIEILNNEQWFVASEKLREDTVKKTKEMKWFPDHMKLRQINWADNLDWDWVISRQRIFATPFPVWYCAKCGETILADEKDLPVNPVDDKPKKKCRCGSDNFIPETDVMDTWMDSSITPLTYAGWPDTNPKLYPSTLRSQGHDIIKTWSYYTTLRCSPLTGKKPFEEVLINGMVQGEDGKKMSKSRNNFVEPAEPIRKYSADAIRQWAAYSVPGSDVPFAWKDIEYSHKFLVKFWNASSFALLHLKDYKNKKSKPELTTIDRWLLSKLADLTKKATESMEKYEFINAITPIQQFVWNELCANYLEIAKYRLYNPDKFGRGAREAAQYTLRTAITTCLRLLAPFTPFFAEEVHSHFSKSYTIFREPWPEAEKTDAAALRLGDQLVSVLAHIRKWKTAHSLAMNAEIQKIELNCPNEFKNMENDLKGTMNIREVAYSNKKLEPVSGKISIKISG